MDEKTLDGAVERFDTALENFRGKQNVRLDETDQRVEDLEGRINEFEALRSSGYYTTGDAKSAQARKQMDQFMREGRGLQRADIGTKATT